VSSQEAWEEDEDYQCVEISHFFLSFAQDQSLERIRSEWCILSSKELSADQIIQRVKAGRLCLPGNNYSKLPEVGSLWYPCLRDKQLAIFEENQSSPAVR
jgi:hypothetical protein